MSVFLVYLAAVVFIIVLFRIAVVVPSGFGQQLAAGERATVAVYLDGSEPTAARVGQAFSTALNQVYGQRVTIEWADAQGLDGGVESVHVNVGEHDKYITSTNLACLRH